MSKTSKWYYEEYLQSEHWKKVLKWHYKKKSNDCCKICETKVRLQVHHRFYRDEDGQSVLFREQEIKGKLLVTLCSRCHQFWHIGNDNLIFKPKFLKRIKQLIQSGLPVAEAISVCSGNKWADNKIILQKKEQLRRTSDDLKKKLKALKRRNG